MPNTLQTSVPHVRYGLVHLIPTADHHRSRADRDHCRRWPTAWPSSFDSPATCFWQGWTTCRTCLASSHVRCQLDGHIPNSLTHRRTVRWVNTPPPSRLHQPYHHTPRDQVEAPASQIHLGVPPPARRPRVVPRGRVVVDESAYVHSSGQMYILIQIHMLHNSII
jgi:hypothetical protein